MRHVGLAVAVFVLVQCVFFMCVLDIILLDDPNASIHTGVQLRSPVVGEDISCTVRTPPTTIAEAEEQITRHETWRAGVIGEGVPFYIYDKEDGVSWTDDLDRIINTSFCVDRPTHFAYRGEVWFLNQLRFSPWRTWNSSAAAVVVLPLFMHVAEHEDCNYTMNDAKGIYDTIRNTELFQRRQEDHLLVWTSPTSLFQRGRIFGPTKFRGNIGVMEFGSHGGVIIRSIVAPFSSVGPDHISEGYVNATRSLSTFFAGRFDEATETGYYIRHSLARQWQNISGIMPNVVFITNDERASILFGIKPCTDGKILGSGSCLGSFKTRDYASNANFIIAPRGDNRNSPRYAEALEFGAIPIFIGDKLFESGIPFQCWVPWKLFSLQVSEANVMCDAASTLNDAMLAVSQDERAVMRTLMHHFRRDILWRATNSRVAENILLEAVRGKASYALLNDMTCPFVDEQRRCTYRRRKFWSWAGLAAECPMSIDLFGYDEKCRGQQCCG